MITLVGVGHIFDIKAQVRSIILTKRPDIVAVELDHARFAALQNPQSSRGAPMMYRMAAHFQKRLAGEYGVQAGEEMLAAVKTAREMGIGVTLIDMDIARVFAEIRRNITFEEKVRLMVAALASFLVRKKKVEKELKNFQEHEEFYMKELGKAFPNLKVVLVDKRNQYMADNIRQINAKYGNVLAVIGDGHVSGMTKLLADLEPEVLRLKDVRNWEPNGEETEGSSVSYSFNVEV